MDITKFSDADFEVKKWVNDALRGHKDTNTPLDAHASMLVMKLQLFIQEVNNSLEETGLQVVQSLPRVLRDVEAVKQEALLLKEQMSIVKEDIKKVESETSASMQRLVDLDSVKTRMQNSKKALQEADNWVSLVEDVDDVFATQDIDKIADKVMRMQQSLNVLHDVPDYEERKKLLEGLKNKVEALISPKLIAAFNDHQMNDAQKYVTIFDNISRKQRVNEYYIQCHKNTIQQFWASLQNSDKSFQSNLSIFYDQLLTKWNMEYTWCSQVFSSPLGTIGKVFGESLNNLSPPLSQVLYTTVYHSVQPVQTFIELRNIMSKFLQLFSNSFSTNESGSIAYPLVEIFHLPYCQLLVQYGSLQQQELMNKLSNINLIVNSIEEMLGLVSQSVSTVVSAVGVAIDNCIQLTDGWGITALIKSVETFFVQFIKKLSTVCQSLQTKCNIETETDTTRNGSQDDWSHLQYIFQLIQCYGDFLLHTKSLNVQICQQIIKCNDAYKYPAGPRNPFGTFDYLRIYHPEEHTAVNELVTAVEKVGDEYLVLSGTTNQIKALIEGAHVLAFDIIFAHLKTKLEGIPKLKVWQKSVSSPLDSPRALVDDLPSFSISPLSYITEIGDHLLTLPQQLEPFTSHDNISLMAALKLAKLPYLDLTSLTDEPNPSDMWLDAIAHGTMETYVESILLIPRLTDTAALQLATDISYLCNVLAAIDQTPIPALTALEKLLKTDKEGFSKFKDDKHTDKVLYQRLSKLRTWD